MLNSPKIHVHLSLLCLLNQSLPILVHTQLFLNGRQCEQFLTPQFALMLAQLLHRDIATQTGSIVFDLNSNGLNV